jgi:hypothetical protein
MFFVLTLSLTAESKFFAGFEKSGRKINLKLIKKNAESEIITRKENETIPQGENYLKIKLFNKKRKTAYFVIGLNRDEIPESASKITLWIKGTPENRSGLVLAAGKWCWKGRSWEGKAQINISENEWLRYEFNAEDFVPKKPDSLKVGEKFSFRDNRFLWFIYVPRNENDGTLEISIDDIEIE